MPEQKKDTDLQMGQEFVVADPKLKGVTYKYTVIGAREGQAFLIAEGEKDKESERVAIETKENIKRGIIERRQIVMSETPDERRQALSIAEEVLQPLIPETGLKQVSRHKLQPQFLYTIRGTRVEGMRFQLGGKFVGADQEAEPVLLFDVPECNNGVIPVVGARNGVDLLRIDSRRLSLPSRLVAVTPREPGVTLWG